MERAVVMDGDANDERRSEQQSTEKEEREKQAKIEKKEREEREDNNDIMILLMTKYGKTSGPIRLTKSTPLCLLRC